MSSQKCRTHHMPAIILVPATMMFCFIITSPPSSFFRLRFFSSRMRGRIISTLQSMPLVIVIPVVSLHHEQLSQGRAH